MSRIDEIKDKRDESADYYNWFLDEWKRDKDKVDELISHTYQLGESVNILLSKLEEAEKIFQKMSEFECDHRSDAATLCKWADEALQQIRT